MLALVLAAPALADEQVPLDRRDPSLATQQAQVLPVPPAAPDALGGATRPASTVDDQVTVAPGVLVRAIHVSGDEDIPAAEMAAVVAPFAGHWLTSADMRDLLAAVSGLARAHGYIFAHSSVPAQSLAAGILRVEVDEGHIDEVRLTGARNRAVLSVLETLKGHAPTASEIERQTMLAQDLPGVVLGQLRYERQGDKGVLFVPVTSNRVSGRAWVDNRGNDALGPLRAQLAVSINRVFSDRDQLSISDLVTPVHPRELNAVFGRYAYQLGNRGTELALFGAYGKTHSGGKWQQSDFTGDSVSAGASIAQPVLRSRKVSLWLNGEFDYFGVDQWAAGTLVRRDRISTVNLSMNGYVPLAGGRLRAGLGVTQGLDIFGSTARRDPLASRPGAGGQFTIAGAWASWAGGIVGPISATFQLTGQVANRPLLAIEQISTGGPVFGRAYDFSERSGDKGVLASAELQAKLIDRSRGLMRSAQIYGFADAGTVANLRNNYGTGPLYSAGLGARATFAASLRLGLEAAFPIASRRYETGNNSPRFSLILSKSF
jgi:hemolysin activation/secretion protein